jgi:hypothetical protein
VESAASTISIPPPPPPLSASTSSTLCLHHLPQRPRGAAGASHRRRHQGLCGQSPSSATPSGAGDSGEESGRADHPGCAAAAAVAFFIFCACSGPDISPGCKHRPLVCSVRCK